MALWAKSRTTKWKTSNVRYVHRAEGPHPVVLGSPEASIRAWPPKPQLVFIPSPTLPIKPVLL